MEIRVFFFFPSLQSMTEGPAHNPPQPPHPRLYSAPQMWIFRNSFSLNQEQPSTSTLALSSSTSASSPPPAEEEKIRNGDGFQQRGQKNSANSLQMCLRAAQGSAALPSLESKEGRRRGESSVSYEGKTAARPSTAGSDRLLKRKEKGDDPRTHCFHSLEELSACRTHELPNAKKKRSTVVLF